ncbi:hypothetical protein BCR42DRAFT_422763 [Absidia repens]|uniref:Cyclin N-terminal domain-containing protein n=1 Tax=Absidia repens TaxID=90262 RepID=A0A1X2I655_9FUNG|nr:hypothetical protein BCR42DRAFT_422763 [Absidia repens]
MKIGVKLHNHRSNGPMDTYQTKRSPFSADYRQGCNILQAIRLYNHRPSQACIAHLATFVTQSWESVSDTEKVDDICQFMNHLLDTTSLNQTHLSLEKSIQHYCTKDVAVPTVCPGITLLFAVRYIERLKQSYGNVKGTKGCSRRLILVAYIIAAKHIHSNLKFIVDTSLPPLENEPLNTVSNLSSPSASTKTAAQPVQQDSSPLTLHPDKLLSTALPISPPVSPKQTELTDPTQYHYFQSIKTPPSGQASVSSSSTGMKHLPSLSSMCSQFNYRVWRMENEFLHFLNGDINVPDCLRLVNWAKQLSSSSTNESTPII